MAGKRRRATRDQLTEAEVAEVVDLMPKDARARRAARPQLRGDPGTKDGMDSGIRIRLGRRWTRIVQDIRAKKYTWEEFCASLSPEELARGQLRDSRGGFMGRAPVLVPREFHLACQRELLQRFNEKVQDRLLDAIDEYIQLSGTAEDIAVREKMLRYIIERVVGPVPKEVAISVAPQYEGFLAGVVRAGGTVGRASRYDRRTIEIVDDIEDDEQEKG